MIAVDIDDSLYSFCGAARQTLLDVALAEGSEELMRAAYAPWTEWRTPPDLMGMDRWLDIIERVHNDEVILAQEPFQGAVETLNDLAEWHELIFISNRATERYDATLEWLTKHGFPVDGSKLVCAGDSDKQKWIQHCQYLIDDRPKTLVSFVTDFEWRLKHGLGNKPRKAFGLMFEYNRGLTDFPGIYLAPAHSWSGLRHYLVKHGLLKEKVVARAN